MVKYIFLLCLSITIVLARHELYEGHTLFEVSVEDVDQAKLVHDIEESLNLDIWSEAIPERPGSVLVAKELRAEFENALKHTNVNYKVSVENIKEALDLENKLMAEARTNRSSLFPFNAVHRYDVVMGYIEEVARLNPNIATLASAGRSFEGREIKYLKISTTNFQDRSKPVVMIESLLHCREWLTLSATLYAIRKLVVEGSESELLQSVDWIIIPIVNPDGYEHSHSGNNARFWRKNRATGYMVGNFCMGVDLNRNFDINWGTASSNLVCSDTFHGSRPYSEPETAAIRDVILEHRDRMALFLDIHSFGSMILYGYGNGVLPPNGLLIHLNGVTMAQTIDRFKWPTKPNYIVGNIQAVLYAASGGASDYAQSAGATYSYTFELPAFNNVGSLNGFLVDPDFFEHAGYETWEGIKAGTRYVLGIRSEAN